MQGPSRRRAAKGVSRQGTGDLLRRLPGIRAGGRRFAKETLPHRGAGLALFGLYPLQHQVGDFEKQLRLQRRKRIQIALAEHLLRQVVSDGRIHPIEVAQRMAVFDFAQPANHE